MKIGPLEVPDAPGDDYAALAAFYSGYAFFEMYRKVVLSQCEELIRAKFAASDTKVSETRIEQLARLHPSYLQYLQEHLEARVRWEQAFLAQGGMR